MIHFYQFRKEKETEYSSTVRERQMKLLMGFYNIFKQDKILHKRKLAYINKIFDILFEDINYKNDIDKVFGFGFKIKIIFLVPVKTDFSFCEFKEMIYLCFQYSP